MATLSPSEIAFQRSHIGDDRRTGITVSNVICYTLAVVAVLLRVFSRRLAQVEHRADDWWIWGALFLFTVYIAAYQVLVHFGLGRHVVLVTNTKGFVVTSIFGATAYNLTMLAIKLSIVYFYRRIFPQRWFKHALIGTGAIVVGTALAQVPLDIVPCMPIASQWDRNVKGKCIDLGAAILGIAISNIITDVILLTLPMPLLWNLKVSPSRRRLLLSLFLLGGCACIVSLVRVFFVQQAEGADSTWNYVNTAELSTVELGVGISSACLPTCRPLYNHCFRGGGARSKAYGHSSRAIRMADITRGWYGNREALGSGGDEGGLHTASAARDGGGGRILVTKEFASESVGSR
ncbi:hypothetical protein HO173_006279 [Letharia columbiana]|uniref:Rhodopsin domain-containing protein n=1 Tax=Letharia columbiana TaxID=112416 RepID=A0A8H6L4V4_9LECA|nr:uncharacterized protein HO173_006279 [Letharia columbiana]KAF6235596.1 hypothetical protein HO173_006279 [Letharia columbiana]